MGFNDQTIREPVTKVVDDKKYTFYYLKPSIATILFTKIIKIIGPSLLELFKHIDLKDENKNINLFDIDLSNIDIGKAGSLLFDKLDGNDLLRMITTLMEQVNCVGVGNAAIYFDQIFTGRIGHLRKVVTAALGVQYADFFGGKDGEVDPSKIVAETKEILNQK